MKTQFFAFLSFAVGVSILATTTLGSTVSNKVVMVDQFGKINAPEIVASATDMASNKTEIAIAQALEQAAANAARAGTNLVAATIKAITDNELVIYRRGYSDSLGVLVALPQDTKIFVEGLNVAIAHDGAGKIQHELIYATNNDAGKVTPAIKYSNTCIPRDQMEILDDDVEFVALQGDYTDDDGNHYGYRYSVKFWTSAEKQGFFIVYLDADAADGDGMTFDIQGGIAGGITEVVETGHSGTLLFEGGLLIDIAR